MLSEAWSPLKIKFNWDASFWTKQMSTLGKLSFWIMALVYLLFCICKDGAPPEVVVLHFLSVSKS